SVSTASADRLAGTRTPRASRDDRRAVRIAATAGRLDGPGSHLADAVGAWDDGAIASARRVVGGARRHRERYDPRSRARPPASRRPAGAVAGIAGRRAVLVAPGGVVGPRRDRSGRGTVLRRLGGVGAARFGRGVRGGVTIDGDLPLRASSAPAR